MAKCRYERLCECAGDCEELKSWKGEWLVIFCRDFKPRGLRGKLAKALMYARHLRYALDTCTLVREYKGHRR